MEKEWDEAPLYMNCGDISKLGFKKPTIYKWFKSENFPPVIRQNGLRVNKYKFRVWLESLEVQECEY